MRASTVLARLGPVAPVRHRVAGRGEVALEVDPHDGVPLVLGGVGEHAVAHDAGVVDHDVEPAERVDGASTRRPAPVPVGHVVAVDDGLAAHRLDLGHDLGGRRLSARRVPSSSAPKSLTTTRAPWRASSRAWPRPSPRPAPVTMATRPSQIPDMSADRTRPARIRS